MATRHGGWGGAAAGAVIGILVSPSIIGTAIVGRCHRRCRRPPMARYFPF